MLKKGQYHQLLGKCTLNPQKHNTINLNRMAKINKTDRQNDSKDLEQLQLSYITGENAKNTTTLKNSGINSTPRYLPKRK